MAPELPEIVPGVPTIMLVGGGVGFLIVLFVIILVLRRSGPREEVIERSESEGFLGAETEERIEVKKKLKEMPQVPVTEEKHKYEAKIQQLTNMLNVERDKLRAKEAEFKQQSNEFVKVTALKDEVDYLQKRLGELENEKRAAEARHNDEIKALEKKHDDGLKASENKVKEFTSRAEEEKATFKAELEKHLKDTVKKHADEAEGYRKEIEDLKTMQMADKRRLEGDLEKRLGEEKRRNEEKLEDVKFKAKDAIQKVTREKDDTVNDLREENERLKKDIDRLKERIRLLEVEHL